MLKFNHLVCVPAILAGTILTSQAALISYEGFDYTQGANVTGQSGGTGWSGAWTTTSGDTTVTSSGLSFGDLDVTGNAQTTAAGATTIGFRSFDSSYGSDGTSFWFSFLAQRNAAVTDFAGISFYNGGTSGGDRTFSIQRDGASSVSWSLSGDADTGIAIDVGQTYLLTVEILFNAGDDTVNLYVDPTIGGSAPTVADATITISDASFDRIRVAAANGADYTFDELRFGDTFLDVTPSTIPEPSTYALLVSALMLGVVVIRKRNRIANS